MYESSFGKLDSVLMSLLSGVGPKRERGAMSNENELNAELQAIELALGELEIERDKGMIDIGRYG
jgi:hypothetical protein